MIESLDSFKIRPFVNIVFLAPPFRKETSWKPRDFEIRSAKFPYTRYNGAKRTNEPTT
jgi:hypothetical protein